MQIPNSTYGIAYQGFPHFSGKDTGVSTPVSAPPRIADDSAALEPNKQESVQTEDRIENSDRSVENSQTGSTESGLTEAELRLISELKEADAEVRRHEMAHLAAAGGLALSGANFTYQRGPDGVNYAVAGEVSIDVAPVPGDPQATIQKMQKIKNAALAPTNPSAQDVKVAANASATATKAASDLMVLQAEEQAKTREETALGSSKNAADAYVRVQSLPEQDTHSFQLAV